MMILTRRRLYLVLLAIAAIGATTAANLTRAWAFERLADGRVAIDIFGQRVALPTTEVDMKGISFYPSQAAKTAYGRSIFSFQEALLDSVKAQQTFDREQASVMVRIITEPARDDRRLILGRFERGAVPWSGAASPLTITIRRSGLGPAWKRGTLPDHWPPELGGPDEDGYFVRPGVKGSQQARASETGYRLPAAQRLWPARSDLVIICRWTGGQSRICQQSQNTSDGRIGVTWSWHEASWRTAGGTLYENYFPKPRWKDLDLRLHEVVDYLLINSPSGNLE